LNRIGLTSNRVKNIKSHNDIEIAHDSGVLKLDVEAPYKPDIVYSNYPEYSDYWKYHRYLARKVEAIYNGMLWFSDSDIYIQYNSKDISQFWWINFGDIRNKCKLNELCGREIDPRRREAYYQAPKSDKIVNYGIESLIGYIVLEINKKI
jgi:hypothetical protein